MTHVARHVWPFFFALGCGSPDPVVAPPSPARVEVAWTSWIEAADLRVPADELAGRAAVSVEARRGRVLALARLGDPDAAPALVLALRDPDPAVRSAAAMGIGGLERDADESAAEGLLRAVAAETDPELRAAMLFDLGRMGSEIAWPILTDALAAEATPERRGACRGLGAAARAAAALPEATLERVATRVADDPDADVRMFCAGALGRLATPFEPAVDDLARAATDADPRVRALALRALGATATATTEVLRAGAIDPDPWVAVAGCRALATRSDVAPEYAAVLSELTSRVESRSSEPWRPVLLAALEAAPTAREVGEAADVVAARIAAMPADHDLATLHCLAARVGDLAAETTTRTEQCGLGLATEVERAVARATLLTSLPRTRERAMTLETLVSDPSARVREALAAGCSSERDAVPLLRALLDDADVGVRIAATESMGTLLRAERARLDEAALALLLEAGVGVGTPTVEVGAGTLLDGELRAVLRRTLEGFAAADDLEGLVTMAGTIEGVRDADLAMSLLPLLAHHDVAVRRAVRAAIESAELDETTIVSTPRASPPRPIAAADLALDAVRARLELDRGVVEIELWPDAAPTTVSRFVELAESGFFDGLTFHRVVPGFVIQGGDPRGDGYGGPDWSQRCEDGRASYERGTVGMALAGRDTGGSQFFVTITPQPHLDGRYTAFGRVVLGMEVVDRTMPGDVIRHVRIERGTAVSGPTLTHL